MFTDILKNIDLNFNCRVLFNINVLNILIYNFFITNMLLLMNATSNYNVLQRITNYNTIITIHSSFNRNYINVYCSLLLIFVCTFDIVNVKPYFIHIFHIFTLVSQKHSKVQPTAFNKNLNHDTFSFKLQITCN